MLQTHKQEFADFQYNLDDRRWRDSLPGFSLYRSERITIKPKVSVIIANYNNAPYLKKMMDSLIHQTIGLDQLQIMFVDDRSTDDSLNVVLPYVASYSSVEIYVLDKNTGGAHGPRNFGITYARGEYLVFLDSDDWYELDALRYLSQLLDLSGDDFAVSGIVQSTNGHLTLKSKPYYYHGDFQNRDIQDLPAEFYGWLGPQGIMVRKSLILAHNLHFVNQRVADDVTFFYQAMRFAKTISQGSQLTTYLNRDSDNTGLSKAINRNFMMSWLRALGYINATYPDDVSKERFLSRRIEWLIHDFCLKRNIGYKFSKKRLKDFKAQLDYYLGALAFDPSPYFRNDFRKTCWGYLELNDITKLYWFIMLFCVRWVLNRKLHLKARYDDSYYYPFNLPHLIKTRLDVHAQAVGCLDKQLTVRVTSWKQVTGFEVRKNSQPYISRNLLEFNRIDSETYQVKLPSDFDNETHHFVVNFDDYSETGVVDFETKK